MAKDLAKIPVSDIKQDASAALKRVRKSKRPLVVTQRGKPAAQRFRERAEQVLKRLERFPNSGRHLPEFPQLPHREVIVWPYRAGVRVLFFIGNKTGWKTGSGIFSGNSDLIVASIFLLETSSLRIPPLLSGPV